MERFKQLVIEANKSLQTADHLAYVTYPLINDSKLIITVAENLHKALVTGMEAILYYDRLYKRIPQYSENFDEKFEMFKRKCALRYSIPRDHLVLISDINRIIKHRKKSSIELARKDKFIMFSNSYKMKMLNINKIKDYVSSAKSFIKQLNGILNNYERRFARTV